MKNTNLLICLLLCTALTSCHKQSAPHYIVGVSQCSDDAWRQKMNSELEDELIFHPDISLRYRHASDNSERQCLQIDSFIQEGVDALIVCPNEALEVQPAVERAFAAGIPVVVADRRVPGNNWSAYVGGDNKQVGYLMATWLEEQHRQSSQTIKVLEITGLPGSTPAVLRHQGLIEGLRHKTGIELVGSASGQWFMADAERVCDSLLLAHPEANVLVAQNDLMARGAAAACKRQGRYLPVMGVDGITGKGGGIEAIRDGIIVVSATYASRGDLVLQRVGQILHGEAFPRETNLRSMLVGREEAESMALLAEERETQVAAIALLRQKLNLLTLQYANQRMVSLLLVLLVLVSCGGIVGLCYMYRYRLRVQKERAEKEQLLKKQQQQLRDISEQLELSTRQNIRSEEEEERAFVARLTKQIEAELNNPELSVESLADSLGMSRSVLFRRVKIATGQSPVELIRHLRLERAKHLLYEGNMSVQQVAYEVGFSSPSYFTKCYKQEYGDIPSISKNRS